MSKLENNPILLPHQIRILKLFFSYEISSQFFLSGGTALSAFYLHHRESKDFDFFTIKDFDMLELKKVVEDISEKVFAGVDTKIKTHKYWEVYLINKSENWRQRIDFIKEQPVVFGELQKVGKVIVDSLENIVTNKILTVFGRLEPKDYLDLYFIIRETKWDFFKLFEKAKKKDTGLHEFYFANIIAEVGKLERFPDTKKPFDLADLRKFYLDLSKKMLKKVEPL